MKVLLVDDHALMLEGLRSLLLVHDIDVVGTASDGLEAVAQARRLRPDVVLMDVHMPNCDGLEATRLLKDEMPDVQIVMLTMAADDETLFTAIKNGASGYLLKNLQAPQFLEMLAGLERGEAPMTRDLAARLMREFAQQARPSPEPAPQSDTPDQLTERQLEVLQLMAQGKTNQEIGDALYITERTVKYHTREILQKLHLRNRAQMVAYAVGAGLLQAGAPSQC
ncbi:MAG: response regulator transcription factor [Anaerolineales bacterium]|nr:response regulator transcription factor [Anaerolineales bacterium]